MTWYWWALTGLGLTLVLVPNLILHLVAWRQGTWLWEDKYTYTFLPKWWPLLHTKSWVWKLLFRGYIIFITHKTRHGKASALDIKLAHEARGHVDHAKRWKFWTLWLSLYVTWPRFRLGAECEGAADGLLRRLRWHPMTEAQV